MSNRRLIFEDWGVIDYALACDRQHLLFEEAISAKKEGREVVNRIIFCEHPPVFTLGKHGKKENLLFSKEYVESRGAAYYETDRGGDITFHGPKQMVIYPIIDLEQFGIGLKQYVAHLESIVIEMLADYNIVGERDSDATGVWIEPSTNRARKICAIGIRSSRYVTMHGLALNVNTDLSYFQLINPCGFATKGVTSMGQELQHPVVMEELKKNAQMGFLHYFQ